MPFLTPDIPDLPFFQSWVNFWQRLEPRSRTDDLTRGLQAQVRDPLWFLTRQWQVGEFIAEDKGSPIKSILKTTQSKLTRYRCRDMGEDEYISLINQKPLETIVEEEKVHIDGDCPDWRLCIQLGYQFEVILHSKIDDPTISDSILAILKRINVAGINPSIVDDDMLMDNDSRQFLKAVLGPNLNQEESRVLDGVKLLDLSETTLDTALTLDQKSPVDEALVDLHEWFRQVYSQPIDQEPSSWQTNRLEYEFTVSAPNRDGSQSVLISREYDGTELDWFDFSRHHDPNYKIAAQIPRVQYEDDVIITGDPARESIPTILSFYGCPNHRWWRFEDAKTDFGALELNKVDLGKLLMMQFALIQSNDWLVIPYELEIGSLCKIVSLEVTNVFNEITSIDPAGKGDSENEWNRWDLFSVSIESPTEINQVNPCSNITTADFLFIPPTLGFRDESPPLETVKLLRDEMANMVWGVETTIRNHMGSPFSGYDAYNEYLLRLKVKQHSDAVVILQPIANQLVQSTEEEIKNKIRVIANNAGLVEIVASIDGGNSLEGILAVVADHAVDNEVIVEEITNIVEQSPLSEMLQSAINANTSLSRVQRTHTPDGIISLVQDAVNIMRKLVPPLDCTDAFSDMVTHMKNEAETQATNLGMLREQSQRPSLKYHLASVIPENWIPYVACGIEAGERDIQLRQGKMIRNDPTNEPEFISPKTRLLKSSPILNEETVSRAGTEVKMVYQRARWTNGLTFLWLSRNVGSGKGEGSSGLRFDYVDDNRTEK
ncbi:hypothetical protein LCGC14_0603730 [marine sediment metagenome]|uniref:Uncharacterized protein n=1 Tax=marine sediment metagenome TaxID=412755 RepID=A0A0F9TVY7_9ZZZZ